MVLYIWRPQFGRAIDLVPHDLSVYHVNDEYSFSATTDAPSVREVELLRRADLVLIHSPELMRRKGEFNPHTMMLPNGVDFAAFSTPRAVPSDLAAIPGPRVGYVGWLKRHLDWGMLESLVDRTRSCSFVFIGPTSPHPELQPALDRMAALPHVHFLGGRPAAVLPDYVQHLDVCLLPYVDNAYTRCIYPLKLHESLAAGKPVVATRLPSIAPFADVAEVVPPGQGWDSALARALSPSAMAPECVAARQDVARAHDWDLLVERLEQALWERLASVGRSRS